MRIRIVQRNSIPSSSQIWIGTEVFQKRDQFQEEEILLETEDRSIRFWTRAPFFQILDYSVLSQQQTEAAEEEEKEFGSCVLDTNFFRNAGFD